MDGKTRIQVFLQTKSDRTLMNQTEKLESYILVLAVGKDVTIQFIDSYRLPCLLV